MHPLRRQSPLTRAVVWLALAGVLLRGLIPVGFMPGWIGAVPGAASWLVICPASELSRLATLPVAPATATAIVDAAAADPVPTAASDSASGDHDASVHAAHAAHRSHAGHVGMAPMSAAEHAAMLAAMAAAPASADDGAGRAHAGHHAQPRHDAPAQQAADHASHAAASHDGHDPAQHHGHVIAAEHQSCPFAGAAGPAVPITRATLELPPHEARLQRADSRAATAMRVAHRLPPPRGPPLHTVVQQYPTTHRARA